MKRIFGIYSYIEWIFALAIIYVMGHVWLIDCFFLVKVLIFMCCGAILCFIKIVVHNLSMLEQGKLWKYHCSFFVDSFTINDKTYYIPVINVLTHWGYFYEYVIRRNGELTPKRTPHEIKKIINKNSVQVSRFIGNFIFTTEEEALFAITQIQNRINKVRQTKKQVKNTKRTKVNFNNK